MVVGSEEPRVGGYTLTPLGRALHALWRTATHPVTALIVAIGVGLGTYFLSKSTKEPVFIVSPPELVAQTVNGEGNLKILWQEKEIKNAASVKVAFWNHGSQYIDKNDISTADPIRLQSSESVRILSVSQLASSRSTLKFTWQKELDSTGGESAVLNLEGDEALERFDGAAFHVLFSGPLGSLWTVTGRIKGAPAGFAKKDWSKVQPPEPAKRRTIIILTCFVVGFFLIILGYEIYSAVRSHRFRWWRVAFALLYCLVLVLLSFKENWGYLFAPHWLPK